MKFIVLAVAGLVLAVAVVLFFSHHRVKKGEVRANSNDGLNYVWIPPGTFMMGCSPGDKECYDFETPGAPGEHLERLLAGPDGSDRGSL